MSKKKKTPIAKAIKHILKLISCNKICGGETIVPVIRLSGVIGSGGTFKQGLSLDDLEDDFKKAFNFSGVKAVAVQINSPGGSPVQSELIFNRIRNLAKEAEVLVYVFIEDLAASGGYWLACVGDEIYASKSSLIGSIGVISSSFGFVDAMKKMGVERRVYAQGDNKSLLDPFSKEKSEDVEILTNAQKDVHEAFKDLVRTRREGKIKKKDEKTLFNGEFWSGAKAVELGLVDHIGDMQTVMKEKYGDKIKFVKVAKSKGWLKRKISGASAEFIDSLTKTAVDKAMWAKFGL